MTIDLTNRTAVELRNYLENCLREGSPDEVKRVLRTMWRAGIALPRGLSFARWGKAEVEKALLPFANIAAQVPNNKRKAFTAAGGLKIGRASGDPDKLWIDSYSGIKTGRVNATIRCHIKEPGDDPVFELTRDQVVLLTIPAERLHEALDAWQTIARAATDEEITQLRSTPPT